MCLWLGSISDFPTRLHFAGVTRISRPSLAHPRKMTNHPHFTNVQNTTHSKHYFRFNHTFQTSEMQSMRLRPGLRPDPTGGAHCAPQTSYLVYGEEWKGRVDDGSGLYSDGKFFWWHRIGSAPHPSSPSQ